jgi:hypothetical protein
MAPARKATDGAVEHTSGAGEAVFVPSVNGPAADDHTSPESDGQNPSAATHSVPFPPRLDHRL